MPKTKPTYRNTKLGTLSVKEIEAIISDNLISVRVYVIRKLGDFSIGTDLARDLHQKLAGNLFEEAGMFRKNQVQLGSYEPPKHFEIPTLMKDWEADYKERKKFAENLEDHIEILSWLMHRFLWIHPFFDYNGRIARLLGEVYLLQNDLPFISFRGVSRNQFAKAMRKATEKDGDLSAIQEIIRKNLS